MTIGFNNSRKRRTTNCHSSSEIIRYQSSIELHAVNELDRQVDIARRTNVLRVSDFDAQYWSVRSRARASDAGSGGLHFTIDNALKGTRPEPFPEPFLSFVKVIICAYERRSDLGFSVGSLQSLIGACRWLYRQFGLREPLPHILVHGDFESAAQAAIAHLGSGAVNVGSKLAFISQQMDLMRLSLTPIDWRNSIKQVPKHNTIGPAADRRREDLMPSSALIDSLAAISSRTDLDDRDLLLQRGIDLCVSVGFRVNELLTLPRDCLVIEPELDDLGNQLLDKHGNPIERLGLRYWPEKGARSIQIKWVPTVMNEVVKRAISDIQRITEPTWSAAVHQRSNSGSSLMGQPWDTLDDTAEISNHQLSNILGVSAPWQFLKVNSIPFETKWNRDGKRTRNSTAVRVKISDLRLYLYNKSQRGNVLRAGEGSQDISECLFLVPKFFVKRTMNGGLSGTVTLVKDANINVFLVGIENSPSIFERLGYIDENDLPFRCPSHKIRHWLNTLALEGGLSDVDLARWMSRQNLTQNRAYDHRSPVQRARRAGEKMRMGEVGGPVAKALIEINNPVRRDEFIKSLNRTAHVTDLGTCVHDWDALPCQKHGACSGCGELRIEKGNVGQRDRAIAALEKTKAELDTALLETLDQTVGADRWLDAHQKTVNSLEKIIAIHEDPTIPDGYLIQIDQRSVTKIESL